MTKWKVLLTAVLMLWFAAACGSDEAKGEPSDSESEAPGSDETDEDAGDEISGADACTDFMTTSWDRIRECESDLAAVLPPNTTAGVICTTYCEVEGITVPQDTFNACLAMAEALPCDAIPSDISAIISEVPDECTFLNDSLNCAFPEF